MRVMDRFVRHAAVIGLGLAVALSAGLGLEAQAPVQAVGLRGQIFVLSPAGFEVIDSITQLRLAQVGLPGGTAMAISAASLAPEGASGSSRLDLVGVVTRNEDALLSYDVTDPERPRLVSVVRLPAPPTSLQLQADERVAHVGLGDRGVIVVDLDGPFSPQPVDLDRDGTDDRLLGLVDTPGRVAATDREPPQAVVQAADGTAGLTGLQMSPTRVLLERLLRDPVRVLSDDDEDVSQSRLVHTTDDGLVLTLSVTGVESEPPVLTLEDRRGAGAAPITFAGGLAAVALTASRQDVRVEFPGDAAAPGEVAFVVRRAGGLEIARYEVRVAPPPAFGVGDIRRLLVGAGPGIVVAGGTVTLGVAAQVDGGRMFNVTRAATGTTYTAEPLVVGTVGADGLVSTTAGGLLLVRASQGGVEGELVLRVEGPPVPVALTVARSTVTLRTPSQAADLEVSAALSDGSVAPARDVPGVVFAAAPAGVVSVDGAGRVTALAEGLATVTARLGSLVAAVEVACEFRTPAALSGLTLTVPPFAEFGAAEPPAALARVEGTGSLDGIPVRFELTGLLSQTIELPTGFDGTARLLLASLPGSGRVSLRASAIDPATGTQRSATATLEVTDANADVAGNDSVSSATPIGVDRPVSGTLTPGGDARDVFRAEAPQAGRLWVTVTLAPRVDPRLVTVVLTTRDGRELRRMVMTSSTLIVDVPVEAGPVFITLETSAGPVGYELTTSVEAGPLTVTGVSPVSGGPGTPVRITGTGFTIDADRTRVIFGQAPGRVVAVTPTTIDVLVPANGVNGPLRVVSGGAEAAGPVFVTGLTQPVPPQLAPTLPAVVRRDPISGLELIVNRAIVRFDPVVARTRVEEIAVELGGRIAGYFPVSNGYLLEFGGVATLEGSAALIAALRARPEVRGVEPDHRAVTQGPLRTIDGRDRPRTWSINGTRPGISTANAYDHIGVFEAQKLIRETPPFDNASTLRPTRVAVVDNGVNPQPGQPAGANEFRAIVGGVPISTVEIMQVPAAGGTYVAVPALGQRGCPNASGVTQLTTGGDHGTPVTSIIAASNDFGSSLSGILNGVLNLGEPPFVVRSYGSVCFFGSELDLALNDIAVGPVRFDVVNLSLGAQFAAFPASLPDRTAIYRDIFRASPTTLFVAAAGNDGVGASTFLPAGLSATEPNVLSAVGTAVDDADASTEPRDQRTVWTGTVTTTSSAGLIGATRCDLGCVIDGETAATHPTATCLAPTFGASNCGPGVTLAAPGEEVLSVNGPGLSTTVGAGYQAFLGTSAASPVIAGVAALVQAVRPTTQPIPPSRLKQLLVQTADDITGVWDPGRPSLRMRRVNALTAVRAVLPRAEQTRIFVSDSEADDGAGALVALVVDPITGTISSGGARRVDLSLAADASAVFTAPSTVVLSPRHELGYVWVKDAAGVAGLLEFSTISLRAQDFIPVQGPSGDAPADGPRPAMAISRDGLLMYVATARWFTLVNLESRREVTTLFDLPRSLVGPIPAGPLQDDITQRLEQLRSHAVTGLALNTPPGLLSGISDLELSPDGRILYAAVRGGSGGGVQQGLVLPIDVNLYDDADLAAPGHQAALDDYLSIAFPAAPTFRVNPGPAGNPVRADEPSDVAVSPDGQHVYLLHGGVKAFLSLTSDGVSPAAEALRSLAVGQAFGVLAAGATGNFLGLVTSAAIFNAGASEAIASLSSDLSQQIASGFTLLEAPGLTSVFSAEPATAGTEKWTFTSNVAFGWAPAGTRVISQVSFPEVFAKRPFSMAISPTGRRAIVAMFQTGNFAVLDLDSQPQFAAPASGVTDVFSGLFAVTPAIELDTNLWPSRGAFNDADGNFVPSPDEALLFPTKVQYASNGRFAVAMHVGVGRARQISPRLPQFSVGVRAVRALRQLGFTIADGATSGLDPDGNPVTELQRVATPFDRGGGAISVIRDGDISADLSANGGRSISLGGRPIRPYFSQAPLCLDTNNDLTLPKCASQVTTPHLGYRLALGGSARFERPSGLAIEPLLSVEGPAFGATVSPTAPLSLRWTDSRAATLNCRIVLLGPLVGPPALAPVVVGDAGDVLADSERTARRASRQLADLFVLAGAPAPVLDSRYRLLCRVDDASGGNLGQLNHDLVIR